MNFATISIFSVSDSAILGTRGVSTSAQPRFTTIREVLPSNSCSGSRPRANAGASIGLEPTASQSKAGPELILEAVSDDLREDLCMHFATAKQKTRGLSPNLDPSNQ